MVYKRMLRYGMSGTDVRYIKEKLHALGYYASSIQQILRDRYGADTLRAVRTFQRAHTDADGNRLAVDGVIGLRTWSAIERAGTVRPEVETPESIGRIAATAIGSELHGASEARRAIALLALTFAFDPEVPAKYPLSLYIRGGNLYKSNLEIDVITSARIDAGAKRQPQYYSGGRADMMKAAAKNNPQISGADCSGGIVGLMRVLSLCDPAFDATADMLCGNAHSTDASRKTILPGDWVGRPEHIGLYVGGGYVAEWMGGAYGCQLSKLDDRRGFDFVTRKTVRRSGWTRFRKPNAY